MVRKDSDTVLMLPVLLVKNILNKVYKGSLYKGSSFGLNLHIRNLIHIFSCLNNVQPFPPVKLSLSSSEG